MSIAGHVSRAMLSRYSHVRMEAKRKALDEIAPRQLTPAEKRKAEAERREHDALNSQSTVVHLATLQASTEIDEDGIRGQPICRELHCDLAFTGRRHRNLDVDLIEPGKLRLRA